MKKDNRILLADTQGDVTLQLELFAYLNLGLVQSLNSGLVSPTEAIGRFYHVDNCLYVQKQYKSRDANAIMSHGVELLDLFDALPVEEAQKEFLYELEKMRGLCLKILEKTRSLEAVA